MFKLNFYLVAMNTDIYLLHHMTLEFGKNEPMAMIHISVIISAPCAVLLLCIRRFSDTNTSLLEPLKTAVATYFAVVQFFDTYRVI